MPTSTNPHQGPDHNGVSWFADLFWHRPHKGAVLRCVGVERLTLLSDRSFDPIACALASPRYVAAIHAAFDANTGTPCCAGCQQMIVVGITAVGNHTTTTSFNSTLKWRCPSCGASHPSPRWSQPSAHARIALYQTFTDALRRTWGPLAEAGITSAPAQPSTGSKSS